MRAEAGIELKVSEYAEKLGCMHLHLNVRGRRGWPDHLYIYKGRYLMIEFKQPGEVPRKLQEVIHERIRQHGGDIRVVDDVVKGYTCIDDFTQSRTHVRGLRPCGYSDRGY